MSRLGGLWVPEALMNRPIENPRISEEINGYQFELEALRAQPLSENWKQVRVLQVQARVSDKKGLDIIIKAGKADYDTVAKEALLKDNVRFTDPQESFLLQTTEALINVEKETLAGTKPVLISIDNTKILGQGGFKIMDQGRRFLVLGETQMIMKTTDSVRASE